MSLHSECRVERLVTDPSAMASRRRAQKILDHLAPSPTAAAGNGAKPDDGALTVVITGCTSGIGRALADEFALNGHVVIGCGRRGDRLDAMAASFGSPHEFHVCDVSSEAAVAAFAFSLRGRSIDVVISNAGGGGHSRRVWEMDGKTFDDTIKVNLSGTFYVTRHLGSMLVAQSQEPGAGFKRLINISSGLGHSTSPFGGAYSPSKWGVESLSKCFAQGLRADNLTNMICVPLAPGVLQTEMNPKGHSLTAWAPVAVPFILGLGPEANGASIAMPGFYDKQYQATWVIPDGLPLPDLPVVRPK